MLSSFLRPLLLIWSLTLCLGLGARDLSSPEEVVRSFYASYLENLGNPSLRSKPALSFSKEFQDAIEENHRVCEEFATGVCGFGADGDIYLDSQEYENGLTLANSGLRISASVDGLVTVRLNVYPSIKAPDGYYEKVVSLKLIVENGKWVVDDLSYADGVSWKVRMDQENDFYRKTPDLDSTFMKKQAAAEKRSN